VTAEYAALRPDLLDDYQLVKHPATYKISKYLGDLVMCQLDRELDSEDRPIRCLAAEPGAVCTSIFDRGFGSWAWFRTVMKFLYWLSFAMVRCSSDLS
jgi:hypothetical protein